MLFINVFFFFSFFFFINKIGKREIGPYLELENLGMVMLHASCSPNPRDFREFILQLSIVQEIMHKIY